MVEADSTMKNAVAITKAAPTNANDA
jgi:hypothetical protein